MSLLSKEKWVWAIATCLVLVAKPAMADSILHLDVALTPSTSYYFGFDREKFDGGNLYGLESTAPPYAPTLPASTVYDTNNAVTARTAFVDDPAFTGFAIGTEDFESFATPYALAPGEVNAGPYNVPLDLSFGSTGITGTLNPDGGEVRQYLDKLGTEGHIAGRYPTSGSKYYDTFFEESATEMTITFDKPVVGFGFYATDSGDYTGRLKLIITRDGVVDDIEFTLPTPTNNIDREDNSYAAEPYNASLLFFGLVDVLQPITAVTFVNVPDTVAFGGDKVLNDDNYGFDDLIAVAAVPEPATFGLLLLGGTALLGYSRRRSRSNAA